MATKRDLIERVAKKLKYLTEHDAADAVSLTLDYIKTQLSAGNRIELRGFGSLAIRTRKHSNHIAHTHEQSHDIEHKLKPNDADCDTGIIASSSDKDNDQSSSYNTIYYRMSKNIQYRLNNK